MSIRSSYGDGFGYHMPSAQTPYLRCLMAVKNSTRVSGDLPIRKAILLLSLKNLPDRSCWISSPIPITSIVMLFVSLYRSVLIERNASKAECDELNTVIETGLRRAFI